jgi:hypothetical protein
MEEGLNSAWLLPNRVYEASRYAALPIALEGVETGRFLARHGFGVRLGHPGELEGFLAGLTPGHYAALRAQLEAVPLEAFAARADDCRALVQAIAGADPAGPEEDRRKLTAELTA